MKYLAYWIDTNKNITYPVPTKHIQMIFDFPERFGLAPEYIRKKFDNYNEPYRYEGKARRELINELLDKEWIRLRYDSRRHEWKINHNMEDNKLNSFLQKWCIEYNILDDNPNFRYIGLDDKGIKCVEFDKVKDIF